MLATAFNTMTAELRETLEGLEKRVADRTEELRLQNAELGALHETTLGVMHRLDVDDLLRELLDARVRAARDDARVSVHPQPGRRGAREPRRDRRLRGGARRAHVARRGSGRPRVAVGRRRSWSRATTPGRAAWTTFPLRPHPRARRRAAAVGHRHGRHARRGTRQLRRAAVRGIRGRAPAALRAARLDRARQRPPVRTRRARPARPPTRRTPRRAPSSRP